MNQESSTDRDNRSGKMLATAGIGVVLGTAIGLTFSGLFAMPGLGMVAGSLIGLLIGAAIGSCAGKSQPN